MANQYAIIGHPVEQSWSPYIHEHFARQSGHDIRYERIDVADNELPATLDRFFSEGGKGLNVTMPHKEGAFKLVDKVGVRARIAAAVNLICVTADGRLVGDNTDGTGLVRDLVVNLDIPVSGQRILLLGAGGAARGVAAPLLGQNIASLTVANRTFARAVELVENLAGFGAIEARKLDDLASSQFDLIINATATGISGEPLRVNTELKNAVCYDLTYGPQPTQFMQWAQDNGARAVHDGWGMLVEQAAESYFVWRQEWPDTTALVRNRPFPGVSH